jgi:hypothetical protein
MALLVKIEGTLGDRHGGHRVHPAFEGVTPVGDPRFQEFSGDGTDAVTPT